MSAFPAVATVLGVSKEVAKSGPLLATLAIDPSVISVPPPPPPQPVEIKAGDPVTQAVVDNIIGKLPTKKEPVRLKCEICDITVSSPEILNTHKNGAKHNRKLESLKLKKEINESPDAAFITAGKSLGIVGVTEYTCKACNVKVNSYQQLEQHFSGTRHKNKAEKSKSNTMEMSVQTPANNSNKGQGVGVVNVDIGPNKLFCAACNVHVNSDLQLHQHITSAKHKNKVNGRSGPGAAKRSHPYARGGKRWNNSTAVGRGSNNASAAGTDYTNSGPGANWNKGRGRAASWNKTEPGAKWNKGEIEASWNQGETGPAWNKGGTGPAWNKGGTGLAWDKGSSGASWNKGETGPAWNKGGTGPAWNKGSSGASWNKGGTGPAWNKGSSGASWNNSESEAAWDNNDLRARAAWVKSDLRTTLDNMELGAEWDNSDLGGADWDRSGAVADWNPRSEAGGQQSFSGVGRGYFNKGSMINTPSQNVGLFTRRPKNYPQYSPNVNKPFVSGGMLY